METPIYPPDNSQQVSLSKIKKEGGGEQSKSGLHQSPEKSSVEKVANGKTESSDTAAGKRSEGSGSWEESLTGESNMEQSENKEDSAMDEHSESNTEQDTTGEAAEMET